MTFHLLFFFTLQAVIAKADFEFANAARVVYPRQIPDACSTWSAYVSFCKSASPGFVSLPATEQVPCLCYDDSGDWLPDIFDDAVDVCAAWAATADVADYTIVDSWQGICTDVGNILAAPASTPILNTPTPTPIQPSPTPTPTAPTTVAPTQQGNPGCLTWSSIIESCNSSTPEILSMDVTSIAACLCYSGNSWVPSVFDNAVASCAPWVQTADPTLYQGFTSNFLGFCTEVGDVLNTPSTPTEPVVIPTPTAKTTPHNPASITPVATTVIIASPTVSTKSSNALRILDFGGSMKALGLSWLVIAMVFASL